MGAGLVGFPIEFVSAAWAAAGLYEISPDDFCRQFGTVCVESRVGVTAQR
ncbi:hypothetical protein J0H58_11635 [bacterium]|nr:hypothetical protein [bacterium]